MWYFDEIVAKLGFPFENSFNILSVYMNIQTSSNILFRNVILKQIKIPCKGTNYNRKSNSQRGEPTLFSIQGSDKDSQNKDEC